MKMKNITMKTKIMIVILAVIIIAGIAVISTMGFNVDLRNQETKKIELYLNQKFEDSDIKNIVNEVMPNEEVIIQKVELFEDTASVIAKNITEEQRQAILDKVNEKYGSELTADTVPIITIPQAKIINIAIPYILPFLVSTCLILLYVNIRYMKLVSIKIVLKLITYLVISEATLISIIAIARIPVGRLTMPMIITVYVFALIIFISKCEQRLKAKNIEEGKKNK